MSIKKKNNLFYALSAILAISINLMSCKNFNNGNTKESSKDSLAVEPIIVNPDSSLASADCIDYQIDCFDTIHSGEISDLHDMYKNAPGILTFRNNFERNPQPIQYTKLMHQPDTIIVEWTFETNSGFASTNFGTWGGGTGWTGQPLFINWPDSCVSRFKKAGFMYNTSGKQEIISASLCGEIFFIDFETGKASRDAILVNHPIKGTPMLDPTFNGLLYVGHGVTASKELPCGQATIDLYKNAMVDVFTVDPNAWRRWNGYDSSPIRVGQFVFRPGENGTIYKWLVTDSIPILHSTLRYKVDGYAPGVESSMSVWRNYGYINDNHGNFFCFNLNTLKPIWRYDLLDDCDCTPLICTEPNGTFLYSGCEVDLKASASTSRFVKLNALTGEEVWKVETTCHRKCIGEKHFDGGYYASPLLGTGNCKNMIFVSRVLNTNGSNGEFVAFNRATGKEIFTVPLKTYSWSSPIGFESADGKFTILMGDTAGNLSLIDGKTGRIICTQKIGANFESSPIAVNNHIVVGSRGNLIYKVRIE